MPRLARAFRLGLVLLLAAPSAFAADDATLELSHGPDDTGALGLMALRATLDGRDLGIPTPAADADPAAVLFTGPLAPGAHRLAVEADLEGKAAVFTYMDGYRVRMTTQLDLEVLAGEGVTIRSRILPQAGVTAKWEDRYRIVLTLTSAERGAVVASAAAPSAPPAEPVALARPADEPAAAPPPAPAAEPAPAPEPRPVAESAPPPRQEPEPVAPASATRPEPEPVAAAARVTRREPEPAPVARREPEPEPVATPAPAPARAAPAAEPAPEPVRAPEPRPARAVKASPPAPAREPTVAPEPEPAPAAPAPVTRREPEPAAAPAPAARPTRVARAPSPAPAPAASATPPAARGSDCALEPIRFPFDRATLSTEARQALDRFADCLAERTVSVRVVGHCDPRGGIEYNRWLAWDRAAAVSAYLRERGIAHRRVSTRFADAADCPEATEDCFAGQRRVEAILLE